MEAYGLSIEHVHVVSPVDEWHVAQTPSDRVVHGPINREIITLITLEPLDG